MGVGLPGAYFGGPDQAIIFLSEAILASGFRLPERRSLERLRQYSVRRSAF